MTGNQALAAREPHIDAERRPFECELCGDPGFAVLCPDCEKRIDDEDARAAVAVALADGVLSHSPADTRYVGRSFYLGRSRDGAYWLFAVEGNTQVIRLGVRDV